ncbi:MAG: UMP kinase [Pseudomonadales bacterium]|nr:UMP kinase [Pseudomonadales bacterium]
MPASPAGGSSASRSAKASRSRRSTSRPRWRRRSRRLAEGDRAVRRLLLKLSGEALAGAAGWGIDPGVVQPMVQAIATVVQGGTEVGLVLGGGNLFRGAALESAGMDRVTGDQMGMLATVMNGLAFRDLLRRAGVPAELFSAIELPGVARRFRRDDALDALSRGAVAIFVAGTGNPFFTTDTAACLRGIEIGAEAVLKATKVDGVYDADPVRNPGARRFATLDYDEVIARDLAVMDLTAICLCRDQGMPIVVFDMNEAGALTRLVRGEKVGTVIGPATAMRENEG